MLASSTEHDPRAAVAAYRGTPLSLRRDRATALRRQALDHVDRLAVPSLALNAHSSAPVDMGFRAAGTEPSPQHQLLRRMTLGTNAAILQQATSASWAELLQHQLAYEQIDDSELENVIASHLPSTQMSVVESFFAYRDEPFVPAVELQAAHILRAIYSPRQLYQRMVIFWSDHFNIDLFSDAQPLFKPTDQREVIRRHALGRFEDLLMASAKSPAMLIYLDNFTNHRDHPNENYARELLELHTMGVDGGYTETDVKEVARCFTGWTIGDGAEFHFDPASHDFGQKVVLGAIIEAGGGVEDGEAVIRLLAEHDSTARFIATKLLRWLIAYEPPAGLVDRIAIVFRNTGGNIRRMVKVALDERYLDRHGAKLKRPLHLVASALRATFGAEVDLGSIYRRLERAGHLPFTWRAPNGYPDADGYWAGNILTRWNDMADLLAVSDRALVAPDGWFHPSSTPGALTRQIDQLYFGGTLAGPSFHQVRTFLQGGTSPDRIRQAIGLAFSSPDFQIY